MFRGYEIEQKDDVWYFVDTGEPVATTWQARPCGHCGLFNTAEGHDGCIGTLPDVMNACCGHGAIDEAYVQYNDGSIARGAEAVNTFGGVRG